MLQRFWRQPSRRYRNFQLVFLALTLNFLIPAMSYTFFPDYALAQFQDINARLGGMPYPFSETESHIWRYLAASDVMTLGLMCLLLQVNLRWFFPILLPLTFMKGMTAMQFLYGYLTNPHVPGFLAVFCLDGLSALAFVVFARSAYADIADRPDGELVPAPRRRKRHDLARD
jgi:hypothetical protein